MDKAPRKQPRKISPRYLENAALHYLQRYATSAQNLRRVLTRKIDRSCRFHKTEPDAFYPLVEKLIERYLSSGLLNDATFAQARVATLRRQGKSRGGILAALQIKGLSKEDIATALDSVDENNSEEAELAAAIALCRKKKLGRREAQKDLAVLGRAGFSYDVARQALKTHVEESTSRP